MVGITAAMSAKQETNKVLTIKQDFSLKLWRLSTPCCKEVPSQPQSETKTPEKEKILFEKDSYKGLPPSCLCLQSSGGKCPLPKKWKPELNFFMCLKRCKCTPLISQETVRLLGSFARNSGLVKYFGEQELELKPPFLSHKLSDHYHAFFLCLCPSRWWDNCDQTD